MVSDDTLRISRVIDNLHLLALSVLPVRAATCALPNYLLPIMGDELDKRPESYAAVIPALLLYIYYHSSGTHSTFSQGDFLP